MNQPQSSSHPFRKRVTRSSSKSSVDACCSEDERPLFEIAPANKRTRTKAKTSGKSITVCEPETFVLQEEDRLMLVYDTNAAWYMYHSPPEIRDHLFSDFLVSSHLLDTGLMVPTLCTTIDSLLIDVFFLDRHFRSTWRPSESAVHANPVCFTNPLRNSAGLDQKVIDWYRKTYARYHGFLDTQASLPLVTLDTICSELNRYRDTENEQQQASRTSVMMDVERFAPEIMNGCLVRNDNWLRMNIWLPLPCDPFRLGAVNKTDMDGTTAIEDIPLAHLQFVPCGASFKHPTAPQCWYISSNAMCPEELTGRIAMIQHLSGNDLLDVMDYEDWQNVFTSVENTEWYRLVLTALTISNNPFSVGMLLRNLFEDMSTGLAEKSTELECVLATSVMDAIMFWGKGVDVILSGIWYLTGEFDVDRVTLFGTMLCAIDERVAKQTMSTEDAIALLDGFQQMPYRISIDLILEEFFGTRDLLVHRTDIRMTSFALAATDRQKVAMFLSFSDVLCDILLQVFVSFFASRFGPLCQNVEVNASHRNMLPPDASSWDACRFVEQLLETGYILTLKRFVSYGRTMRPPRICLTGEDIDALYTGKQYTISVPNKKTLLEILQAEWAKLGRKPYVHTLD